MLEQIIKDLGPTGLLVVGLYFILDKQATKICAAVHMINDELRQIIDLLITLSTNRGAKQ